MMPVVFARVHMRTNKCLVLLPCCTALLEIIEIPMHPNSQLSGSVWHVGRTRAHHPTLGR